MDTCGILADSSDVPGHCDLHAQEHTGILCYFAPRKINVYKNVQLFLKLAETVFYTRTQKKSWLFQSHTHCCQARAVMSTAVIQHSGW